MKIQKILIANRGEIAVRIIRACRELGIKTVQVYSSADSQSLAVEMADESISIGSPIAAKSYLNKDVIIEVAKKFKVDAIHPGYGFLSENDSFVEMVEKAGIIFVGPDAFTIRKMGNKAAARKSAIEAQVPVVPGSDGVIDNLDQAKEQARKIGYPVMIKATAGGGGRGIRIVHDEDAFEDLFNQATIEAKAAFGDGDIYLEKVIENARHIEVQIMGDGKNVIHFFERECSLQRRRQKVWEEAPCAILSDYTRKEICEASVALAKEVQYRGAGTIEYLYDQQTENFYFIEMNTRIQVEHPVTESITKHDLIIEMIKIAAGEELSISQSDLKIDGHAIEVRINAENPSMNFMPSPGKINFLRLPSGFGVRFDHMLYSDYEVQPFYDSMLGKLIVWASTREKTLEKLQSVLHELKIGGINTTIPLFHLLLQDPNVRTNSFHCQWLEPWLEKNIEKLKKMEA